MLDIQVKLGKQKLTIQKSMGEGNQILREK